MKLGSRRISIDIGKPLEKRIRKVMVTKESIDGKKRHLASACVDLIVEAVSVYVKSGFIKG